MYKTKTVQYTMMSPDKDIGKKFVESLESELGLIHKILKTDVGMIMTLEDEINFGKAEKYYACDKPFDKTRRPVCDHCHLTGKYCGAACNSCNLQMRVPRFVPVLFHNLEGYDSHLFIKILGYNTNENITCIPKTDEKYISFSKSIPTNDFYVGKKGKVHEYTIELRFLDSLKFTQSSLGELVGNVNDDQFVTMREEGSEEQILLLKRKGVFPYRFGHTEQQIAGTCCRDMSLGQI